MGGSFKPEDHPETNDNTPLAAGEYIVSVEKAELRETKAGTGKGVNVQFTVEDGPCEGRKAFAWFNVRHQNEKAQEIGQRELASMARAAGLVALNDTDELLGKMLVIKVKVKDDRNEVTSYKPVQQAKPATQAPTSTGKMPWEK